MGMTFDYITYGNFEKPMAGVSPAFSVWSEWKRKTYSRSVGVWGAILAGYLMLLAYKWKNVDRTHRSHNRTLLHALMALSCVLEFIVVATFEANGPKKHFFIFNVLVDIVCLLAAVDLVVIAKLQLDRLSRYLDGLERFST
jgi:hypothetical protein